MLVEKNRFRNSVRHLKPSFEPRYKKNQGADFLYKMLPEDEQKGAGKKGALSAAQAADFWRQKGHDRPD